MSNTSFQPEKMILKGDKWDSVFETLRTSPVLNATDAGRDVALSGLITSSVEAIYQAMSSGWTMMLGYSSGKDSESLLHLFLMALVRVVRSGEITSRNHFILHTDTGIENPEVHWLAQKKLAALQRFIDDEKLPLTIVLAKPGITSSWTGRILTGRGLPTFANSSVRQCSNDLKINAAQRAKNAFLEGKRLKGRVCLMLGSRDAESSIRAGNIAKKKGRADTVVKKRDGGELYPVKNWLAADVWEFLLSCGTGSQYPLPSYLENNNETAEMYRAATGECVWTATDKRQNEACGARFGCSLCQAVGLDKSMETLLNSDPEKYGYMRYLNRIQRYLAKRRYAWEDRHPVGRTIYGGGYIKIQPDVYSPLFLERLLHICCSVDFAEQLRADEVLLGIIDGSVEDNAHNRRMAEPQFRLVSEAALIHIDFMWSFHHFNARPYRALEIYHKVWSCGVLDLLDDEPEMNPVERTPIPEPYWLKVGRWGDDSVTTGLVDPMAEMVYFDGGDDPRAARSISTPDGTKKIVTFCQDDEMVIDADSASFIIHEEYPRLRTMVDGYTPCSAALYYLRFGVVQIATGKAAMYDRMMQRGQSYHQLGLSGQQTMASIIERKDLRILKEERYHYVLKRTIQARIVQMRWWCFFYLVLSNIQLSMTDVR